MKFEHTEVFNFENAFRGMRNPKNSWNKSDSYYDGENYIIGENDMKLATTLIKAGSEHRKFLRQIFISVDITAPLYWWKQFSTYKVGVTENSTSTMHKLVDTPITIDCFEIEKDTEIASVKDTVINIIIPMLEWLRKRYNKTKERNYWIELVRWLPESWLQKRTVAMSYENVLSMVKQRGNHKLTEWRVGFMEWAKSLPYANEFIFMEE